MPSLQVTKYPVVGEAGQLSVPEASISQLAALLVGSGEVRDAALFCCAPLHKTGFPGKPPAVPPARDCAPPLRFSASGSDSFFM